MSSAVSRAWLAVLVLAAGTPDRMPAQDAARYAALVDSLALDWRRLRAAEQRRDSLAGSGVRLDTVRVGPFTLIARAEQAALVAAAARAAWDRLRPVLGRDTLLGARQYYLHPHGAKQPSTLPSDVSGILYSSSNVPEELANKLIHQLELDLAWDAGPLLRAWAGVLVPLERPSLALLARAYLELVTSGTEVTPDCVGGDVEACAVLLRLRERELPSVPERPILTARRSLMQVALEMGGDGAYGRMLSAQGGTVADQLAAAAGGPSDTVLRRWHTAVTAARPESTILTKKGAWMAFFWVVLFVAVASRSSRWRLA